jgi:hypothetical protein
LHSVQLGLRGLEHRTLDAHQRLQRRDTLFEYVNSELKNGDLTVIVVIKSGAISWRVIVLMRPRRVRWMLNGGSNGRSIDERLRHLRLLFTTLAVVVVMIALMIMVVHWTSPWLLIRMLARQLCCDLAIVLLFSRDVGYGWDLRLLRNQIAAILCMAYVAGLWTRLWSRLWRWCRPWWLWPRLRVRWLRTLTRYRGAVTTWTMRKIGTGKTTVMLGLIVIVIVWHSGDSLRS